MMTIKKYRSLNPGEQYPLSEQQLRTAFVDTDLHISLGLTHRYVPDTRISKKQLPSGHVVACLILNHQGNSRSPTNEARLSLYSIPSAQWNGQLERKLIDRYLPAMQDWLSKSQSLSRGIGGFSWYFITLNEHTLHPHTLHCM